jgi:hypothetical protein
VIENVGEQIVQGGFLSASQLRDAGQLYADWARTDLVKQTLAMRTVVGRVPVNTTRPARLR